MFKVDKQLQSHPGLEEHDYHTTCSSSISTVKAEKSTENPKRKRGSKASRPSESIKNSRKFLELSEAHAITDQEYKKQKLQLLKRQCEAKENYYKEKLSLLKIIAESGTPLSKFL